MLAIHGPISPKVSTPEDVIWNSSRTARQIHDLGRVENDIGRLLSLASSSLALLALPQTDAPDAGLPQGDERSEQFVVEVGKYFETLDSIQMALAALRSSLAHIRAARISPAILTAPPAGFVPPAGCRAPLTACSWRAATLVGCWRRRRREGTDAWSA
ncbi:hypothetical protein EDB83DRAFT_1872484 [Lactarius deliciosus]|nr:hypothetical protein EDB83DRAFT_1872484 [Lactarius deliciosus]